eukprot:gene8949-6426_t
MEMVQAVSAFLVAPLAVFFLQEWHRQPERERERMEKELKAYTGSCHCNSVRFNLLAPRHLVVWNCNCSICFMKKNWHFVIPAEQFSLLESSKDYLTEYRFNTKTARHLFCKICGVQAYYVPRSNPDGVAVTLACIPVEQVESFELRNFDGQNWESFYACSNISRFSGGEATKEHAENSPVDGAPLF